MSQQPINPISAQTSATAPAHPGVIPPSNGNGTHRASSTSKTLLIVGDDALAARIERLLPRESAGASVVRVDGYLGALGEMAGAGAPAVLVGRLDSIDGSFMPVVTAVRRLAPQTKLLLLIEPHEEPEAIAAVVAGFDDYLLEPLDPAELSRAIGDLLTQPSEHPHLAGRVLHGPTHVPETSVPTVANPSSTEAAPPAASPSPSIESSIATHFMDESARPPADTVPDAELGDIDLVEHALADPQGLRALALRLLAARTGWLAGWAANAEQAPSGTTCAALEYQGQDMGVLHAPASVDAQELAAWAAWLSRWVALENQITTLREQALRDELTGVWNRRYFVRFLNTILQRATAERFQVTVLLFDIDDFKLYNDRYGHAAGDDILRETARLIQSAVRNHDVVARIGGDEFAVVFWDPEGPRKPNTSHPNSVLKAAERFQRAILQHKFPKLLDEAPGTLTISGGLAGFPWDGRTARELVDLADAMALQSKRQGKNAVTFGPGAARALNESP